MLGLYHFCPLLCSSLHEMFPCYLLFPEEISSFPFSCLPLPRALVLASPLHAVTGPKGLPERNRAPSVPGLCGESVTQEAAFSQSGVQSPQFTDEAERGAWSPGSQAVEWHLQGLNPLASHLPSHPCAGLAKANC